MVDRSCGRLRRQRVGQKIEDHLRVHILAGAASGKGCIHCFGSAGTSELRRYSSRIGWLFRPRHRVRAMLFQPRSALPGHPSTGLCAARQNVLADALKTKLRPGAKPGDLFVAPIAEAIRHQVAEAFAGPRKDLLMDGLAEQNEAGKASPHPVTINQPTDAPKLPPQLIDVLPPLPKQVEYAFVGRTLLLKDVGRAGRPRSPARRACRRSRRRACRRPAPRRLRGASSMLADAADPRRHGVRAHWRQRIGRSGAAARSRRRCSPISRRRAAFRSC